MEAGFGAGREQELHAFSALPKTFSRLFCLSHTWGGSAPKQK